MLTLVLCRFSYDWVILVVRRQVPDYFRRFLRLDIQIVRYVIRVLSLCMESVSGVWSDLNNEQGPLQRAHRVVAHFADVFDDE